MKELLLRADEYSRRQFMNTAAQAFLGVTVWGHTQNIMAQNAGPAAAPVAGASAGRHTAKSCIYLYMSGGMTHLDTFDPKPGTNEAGPVSAIRTKADDVFLSEYFPRLAFHMDKVALVRSLKTNQGAHEQGNYYMHTSYAPRNTIKHPAIGPWMTMLTGRYNRTLPGTVVVGGGRSSSAGFFPPQHMPLILGNASEGLKNSRRPGNVSENEFQRRLSLAEAVDRDFVETYNQKKVLAYSDMYKDAVRLMKSEDLKAFDINRESTELQAAYGNNGFGQGLLLARRLVENNVRFVEVQLGGWDTHNNNFTSVSDRAATVDRAPSTLISDLDQRGLLDETLIVLATEFGRTPRINGNDGRDHYPRAFSGLIAGGGIRGGQAYGKTDESGSRIIENPVLVPDFNATIATALGLDINHTLYSPSGRPFKVANNGTPVLEIVG